MLNKIRIMPFLALVLTSAGAYGQQASPTSTFCSEQDLLFTQDFDRWGVVFCGLLGVLILPLLLPRFFRYRKWWMTRTVFRWALIAGALAALTVLLYVGLPSLAVNRLLPPTVGFIMYSSQPRYLDCVSTDFYSRGVLWSLLGEGRTPAVVQSPTLLMALFIGFTVWAGFYWVVFLLLRLAKGLWRRV